MQNVEHHFIIGKIGRAHREKDSKSGNNLPIIVKFTDWNISEEVKSCFITAAKNEMTKSQSQFFRRTNLP